MKDEIKALELNHTWDIVELPEGKHPIGCKWVYKIKYDSNGNVAKYKARLVAKGYTQTEDVDYYETFSPVVKMVTVRAVLTLAAVHNWDIFQMDVHNAFLQGDLHEEVYMVIPKGFKDVGKGKVCKLTKSLYGLKQASRQWNAKLTLALVKGGFKQSLHDYSLFIKWKKGEMIVVLVYVDDLLITGSNREAIEETKTYLHTQFRIKDLGAAKYFLGLEIARSKAGIVLNQRKYTLDLISDVGLSASIPAPTPMEQNAELVEHPRADVRETDQDPKKTAKKPKKIDKKLQQLEIYQNLIGRLSYLTVTRPDICYPVQVFSQFLVEPRESHMNGAMRVLHYLKGTPSLGILLSSNSQMQLECYCDSDWAACKDSRRSVTGYAVKLGGSLISWKSKKQNSVQVLGRS